MKHNIGDYKLYIFDLDGTLYDQPMLRLIMATRLVCYYICHPIRIKELLVLKHFRKVKDKWNDNSSEGALYDKVAADKRVTSDYVERIVRKWIYDNPLSALLRVRDEKLAALIKKLRQRGKIVVIFSDYPTEDKLKALKIEADGRYGPEDKRIDELKPSPKGLKVILEDYGMLPEDALMIGDREEKDGMCARAASVDCLILKRNVRKRDYNEIGI